MENGILKVLWVGLVGEIAYLRGLPVGSVSLYSEVHVFMGKQLTLKTLKPEYPRLFTFFLLHCST